MNSEISKMNRKINRLGSVGIWGAAVFSISILILQILEPSVNLFHGYVSNYANSRYGWLFTITIIIHGLTNLGIAYGINLTFPRYRFWVKLGLILFAISSVGIVLAGLFPTDGAGVRTLAGKLHTAIATGSFVVEPLALALLAYEFSKESWWRSYAFPTALFALGGTLVLAWLAVSIYRHIVPGFSERLALIVFLLWEILTARRLVVFKEASNTYNR